MEQEYEYQSEIMEALVKKSGGNCQHCQRSISKDNIYEDVHETKDATAVLTKELERVIDESLSGKSDSEEIITALSDQVKTIFIDLVEKQRYRDQQEIESIIRAEVEEEMDSLRNQKDTFGKELARLQGKLNRLLLLEGRVKWV